MLNALDEFSHEYSAIDPCRPQAPGDRCDRRSVRLLHPAGVPAHIRFDKRTGVRRPGPAGMDRGCRCQDRLHRRGSPWENGYVESFNTRLRDELLTARSSTLCGRPRSSSRAGDGTTTQPACLNRIQATRTRRVRAYIRRVAGCVRRPGLPLPTVRLDAPLNTAVA